MHLLLTILCFCLQMAKPQPFAGATASNLNPYLDMKTASAELPSPRKRINWKDSAGMKFGRWTVVKWLSNDSHCHKLLCVCECGVSRPVSSTNLASRSSSSCGCYSRERSAAQNRTHGMSGTRFCMAYNSMIWRSQNRADYSNRPVCDRWLNGDGVLDGFHCFMKDMGAPPAGYITVERVNNKGPYSPENCKWGTRLEQNNNRDISVRIEYQGAVRTRPEWARILGISNLALRARFRRGLTVEQAFNFVDGRTTKFNKKDFWG